MPHHAPPHPAAPAGLLGSLGRACHRHRWLTLLAWLAGVACLIILWTRFGAPPNDSYTGSDPGAGILARHFPRVAGDSLTLAIRSSAPVTSPPVRSEVTSALAPFARAAQVTSVVGPYQSPGQIASGGHIAFATVHFAVPSAKISNSEVVALMGDARAASRPGLAFYLGGDVVDTAETPYGGPTEGFGLTAAAIVLVIAFGSLLAMGLPILTALLGIGGGLSVIALLGHIVPAPSFSPIVASMIGLGVGVDYALFIVTRFREALREGLAVAGQGLGRAGARAVAEQATVTAMRTAGRSVLIAGATVVISMLGLFVLREPLLNGVAVAAAATVAMVLAGSLTLLPALIGFTGLRLARRPAAQPGRRGRVWLPAAIPQRRRPATDARPPAAARWAAVIQRRPAVFAIAAAAMILALATPALGMRLSMPDESSQARGTMGYASYATMARGFGPGFDAPVVIAAELPTPGASIARLASAIAATPGVAAVTPPVTSRDKRAVVMIAYPTTGEQDPATDTLVNRLRSQVVPHAIVGSGVRAYLTGPNAANVAFANLVGQRLPWLIGAVVLASMALLTAMFRSVVIAVKAAAMNLLSISASYGALVLIVQHGWLGGLFGFPENMPVTTWVPIFLFVILFGLSMDYEVFLLSRVRECYDATGDNARSVASGLAATARVITAAAAIMVVVFLSFVLGANVSVKQIGLGLAVAVLIDASVVRMVLAPAVMELLGPANWWLPRIRG